MKELKRPDFPVCDPLAASKESLHELCGMSCPCRLTLDGFYSFNPKSMLGFTKYLLNHGSHSSEIVSLKLGVC